MTRSINKTIASLFLLSALASVLLVIIFSKYLPLLLHKTVYFCQQIAQTMNFKMLPENANLGIWLFVTGLLLFILTKLTFMIVGTIAFGRTLKKTVDLPLAFTEIVKKHKLTNKVSIVVDKKPFAFCFGLFKPRIYISTGLLNTISLDEIDVILLHEKYHLTHHDIAILVSANFILNCLPFIPFLRDVVYKYRIERELEADAHAASEVENGKDLLVSILRKLLLHQSTTPCALAPAIASIDTLEARIHNLVSAQVFKHEYSIINTSFSLFSLVLLSIFALTPVYAVELHHDHSDMIVACSDRTIDSLVTSSENFPPR